MGAPERPAGQGSRGLHRGAATVALLFALSLYFVWSGHAEAPATPATGHSISRASDATPVARRETRPTLDSALFVGKAAAGHRVAREMPELLDQLYCYCQCDKHQGHKSLLSCYTDGHAAT